MTRENRPTVVHCSGPCDLDVDARSTREYVLLRSLTNSGRGTLTSPLGIERLQVYVCAGCERRMALVRPKEAVILVAEIARSCQHLLHFAIPSGPTDLFGTPVGGTTEEPTPTPTKPKTWREVLNKREEVA